MTAIPLGRGHVDCPGACREKKKKKNLLLLDKISCMPKLLTYRLNWLYPLQNFIFQLKTERKGQGEYKTLGDFKQ